MLTSVRIYTWVLDPPHLQEKKLKLMIMTKDDVMRIPPFGDTLLYHHDTTRLHMFYFQSLLTTCRLPSPLRCHEILKELTRYYGVTRSQEMHPVANFVISQTPLLPCLQPEGELLQYRGRILISRDTVLLRGL
jgi:hypothetical protein